MRKRIIQHKKSEIENLYLEGLTRDDISKKTGVSAGGVTGVIKELKDYTARDSGVQMSNPTGTMDTYKHGYVHNEKPRLQTCDTESDTSLQCDFWTHGHDGHRGHWNSVGHGTLH